MGDSGSILVVMDAWTPLGRRLPSHPSSFPRTPTLRHHQFIYEHGLDQWMRPPTRPLQEVGEHNLPDMLQNLLRLYATRVSPADTTLRYFSTWSTYKNEFVHRLTPTSMKTLLLNWCPYVIEIHLSTVVIVAHQNAMARTCFSARFTYFRARI